MRVEILTYTPTEFYHCQHCEIVWDHLGVGQPIHAEQRAAGLPADLQAEYADIAAWVGEAQARYGSRITFRVVDAASVEGLIKSVRHRARRFPAFILDGQERVLGFDRDRLDAALERRLGGSLEEDSASRVVGRGT
jgi:hypothetical protein